MFIIRHHPAIVIWPLGDGGSNLYHANDTAKDVISNGYYVGTTKTDIHANPHYYRNLPLEKRPYSLVSSYGDHGPVLLYHLHSLSQKRIRQKQFYTVPVLSPLSLRCSIELSS